MRVERQIPKLGIRWTIGDVSDAGFEALRLSVRSAVKLFGACARYAVGVNTIPLSEAAARTGEVDHEIEWLDVNGLITDWFHSFVGLEMAEAVAWKLSPIRVFPDLHELSLDNDVNLWEVPQAVEDWLRCKNPGSCLISADVQPALGQYSEMCRHLALNSGSRGLPPWFDMEEQLQRTLTGSGIKLESELDEQGLQAAVLLQSHLYVVSTDEVSICSPFENHQDH